MKKLNSRFYTVGEAVLVLLLRRVPDLQRCTKINDQKDKVGGNIATAARKRGVFAHLVGLAFKGKAFSFDWGWGLETVLIFFKEL